MEVEKLIKKVCNRETIMYLIFGVLTTLVTLIVYYGLIMTILNPDNAIQLQVANVVSWTVGVVFAYFTNRKYVFESKSKEQLKEASKFVASRISTLLLDMLIMFVGVTLLKANDKMVKILSQVLVIVTNYILSKLFVFSKNKEN